MTKLYTALFFLLSMGLGQLASGQAGCTQGPYPASGAADAYGYTWISDSAMGGPSFDWIDIEQSANEVVGFTDDNFIGPIDMADLYFDYYWLNYEELYIGSNGYIIFDNPVNVASGAGGFPTFPQTGPASSPNNYIGVLLADLTFTDDLGNPIPGAAVYAAKARDSLFVVTFKDVAYWTNENDGEFRGKSTFQVILNANSGDITLQYESVDDSVAAVYTDEPGENFLTRGFENVSGGIGSCIPSNVYPGDSSVVFIERPASSTVSVTDIQLDWIQDEDNFATSIIQNAPSPTFQVQVSNVGTENIGAGDFDVLLLVRDPLDPSFSRLSSATVPALNVGESIVVPFNDLRVDSSIVTQYKIDAEIVDNAGNETNISNNIRDVEVVVVDTSDATYFIGYDRFILPEHTGATYNLNGTGDVPPFATGVDGTGASLRLGTYLEPAAYPADVTEIELGVRFLSTSQINPIIDILDGATNWNPIEVTVFEDNNGQPGAQLFIDTLQPSEMVLDGESQQNFDLLVENIYAGVVPEKIQLPTAINLTSGGLFVKAQALPNQRTDSIDFITGVAIDQETTFGRSFRTYEITGNSWAPYRSRNEADFAIRLGISGTVSSAEAQARQFSLGNVYPNPANQTVHVPMRLDRPAEVEVRIMNTLGQVVHTETTPRLFAGPVTLRVAVDDLTDGLYFYTVSVNGQTESGRVLIAH